MNKEETNDRLAQEGAIQAAKDRTIGDGDTLGHVSGTPGTWNTSGLEGGRYAEPEVQEKVMEKAQKEYFKQAANGADVALENEHPNRQEAEKELFTDKKFDAEEAVGIRHDMGETEPREDVKK